MSCAPDSECGCGAASCCEGADALVPEPIDNAPGQSSLRYRVGTYSSFFETMLARLVMPAELPGRCASDPPDDEPDPLGNAESWPLRRLTTRETDDPTIALLDAWAMVGDVLTFYQERIANEGYLRTATDLRSVQELARLVGYRPRPGVAASAELAFTIEPGQTVEIPAGTKAQSLPGPGQLPAVFETTAPLRASAEWNAMPPLLAVFSVPKLVVETPDGAAAVDAELEVEEVLLFEGQEQPKWLLEVYLEGLSTNLRVNSVALVFGRDVDDVRGTAYLYRVERVEPLSDAQQTRVLLRAYVGSIPDPNRGDDEQIDGQAIAEVKRLVKQFDRRESPPKPVARKTLGNLEGRGPGRLAELLNTRQYRISDREILEIVGGDRVLRESLRRALEDLRERREGPTRFHAFRASSPLFGYNASNGILISESDEVRVDPWKVPDDERDDRLFVDAANERVRPGSFVVVDPREPTTASPELKGIVEQAQTLVHAAREVVDSMQQSIEGRELSEFPPLDVEREALKAARNALDRAQSALDAAAASVEPAVVKANAFKVAGEIEGVSKASETVRVDGSDLDPQVDLLRSSARSIEIPASLLPLSVYRVETANVAARTAYGISKTALDLTLDSKWIERPPAELNGQVDADLAPIRRVMTHIESEALRVARVPLGPLEGDLIEFQGLYFDLEPGRMLIVEGEDYDARGARRAERRFIQAVDHDIVEVSTRITLTKGLQHRYVRRNTVIYGNVAVATQGESHVEILGSGDASRASQAFTLRHKPLTHVPAATVDGVASTLTVRVNGLAWPQEELQALLGPRDRKVVTRTDEQGRTMVLGGDGWRGARFPTGLENVAAEYRSGQGPEGNVDPGKITNLPARPYGVQKVTNPVAASGGAGPDGIEAIRTRVALSVMALDRLVSVEDHEQFALRFAGVVKASARLVPVEGVFGGQRVRVIIAGSEPRPLEPDSELVVRLRQALHRFGDPSLAIAVVPAKLEALSIHAKLQVAPGYVFREVEPRVRAALTSRLAYDVQGIGQAIHPSRIVTIIQEVAGVDFVDLEKIEAMGLTDDDPLDPVDQDSPPTEADPEPPDNDRVILPGADTILFVDATRRETLDLQEWMP